jgi:hypothetical protein
MHGTMHIKFLQNVYSRVPDRRASHPEYRINLTAVKSRRVIQTTRMDRTCISLVSTFLFSLTCHDTMYYVTYVECFEEKKTPSFAHVFRNVFSSTTNKMQRYTSYLFL